jgi:hypothetical protein
LILPGSALAASITACSEVRPDFLEVTSAIGMVPIRLT